MNLQIFISVSKEFKQETFSGDNSKEIDTRYDGDMAGLYLSGRILVTACMPDSGLIGSFLYLSLLFLNSERYQ